MTAAISLFSYIAIIALLGALAYRDHKEYILPDKLNAALALSFAGFHIAQHWMWFSPALSLLGAGAGGGFLLLIRAAANRFYKDDALGLGDVKLMAAAGIGLGYPGIFLALSLGAFFGLLHGLGIAYFYKIKKVGEVNVPAGVGLCLGILLVMFWQFGISWLPRP